MAKVEGIERMFLSGTRATFTMRAGAKPDEELIRKALKKQGLAFVALTTKETSHAAAAWVARTPGLT